MGRKVLFLMLNSIVNYIWPVNCSFCGSCTDKKNSFCKKCLFGFCSIPDNMCRFCGCCMKNNLISCAKCKDLKLNYVDVRSFCTYEGIVPDIIHEAKYNDRIEILSSMVDLMIDVYDLNFWRKLDIVTNIPMDKRSAAKRKYNQSALMAQKLSEKMKDNFSLSFKFIPNALLKIRSTLKQSSLCKKDRLTNLQGSMELDLKQIPFKKNLNILIVDDVVTTGSTIKEASRAIKAHFPDSNIFVISFARTLIR